MFSSQQLYLITVLLTVLSVAVQNTLSSSNEAPIHAVWIDKLARFDFIFTTSSNNSLELDKITRLTGINTSSLTHCTGEHACLLRSGNFVNAYNLSEVQHPKVKKFIFNSTITSSTSNNSTSTCSRSLITVNRFCTTHWNPPIHITGDGCNHTVDWHSPLNCPKESTNYEHPCYVYDSSGKLIDLTPLIKSDGSSYRVNTGNYTISKFRLNVCNEAHDMCGPNVASCYDTRDDSFESGHNNLTSLAFNVTDKSTTLVLSGQYNESCPDDRMRTLVKFRCNYDRNSSTGPNVVNFSPCESIIDWRTIHACPLSETQAPATECLINNEAMKMKIDLRQITGGGNVFTVPGINIGGKEKSMMLGLCRGIKSSELKCEGKSSSMTSACLIDSGSKNESQIISSISKAFIKLSDNRVHLEASSINKDCQVPMGRNFNATKKIGTRIEFFCSSFNYSAPAFVAFEDCTYIFEWGTSSLCYGDINESKIVSPPLSSKLPDHKLETSLEQKNQSLDDMHNENMQDAKEIIDSATKKIETQEVKPSFPSSITTINSSLKPTEEKTLTPLGYSSSKLDKLSITLKKEPVRVNKMNFVHKVFMIALILMSLTGFLVTIFILDRKTQLRIQLGSLRRQARHVFQPQQVPYSRVDSLDL